MSDPVPWKDFKASMDWRQGEHVTLVGPTGAGKTFLARELLPLREYVAVAVTKPRDSSVDEFKAMGYRAIESWDHRYDHDKRLLVRPKVKRAKDMQNQSDVMYEFLDAVFHSGRWCVYMDELRYMTKQLGLQSIVETMYLQGRSLKLSLVGATQRPVWVPREMFSEPTHFFLWRMTDTRDLKVLREISGAVNPREIEDRLKALPQVPSHHPDYHNVLYVNARSGMMVETRATK